MMNGNGFFTRALIGVMIVLLAAPAGVFAQGNETNQQNDETNRQNNETNQTFSQAELDSMLAPIALYPDSLLAQVLIASTYPDQVVEADRWVKEHQGMSKDELNAALDKMDWDLSVKALVPFPQVLAKMDEDLDWTSKLGKAFLAQEKDVMASIQGLRAKAYAKGNLRSTEQQKVSVEGENIEIEPANPEVVYVPYYDPMAVYGDWWWPGYPPFAFFPFWGPFLAWGPFGFGIGIGVGAFWGSGWGNWNWGRRDMAINANRNVNINRSDPSVTRNMRTTSFSHVAAQRAAATGRTAGAGRTGAAGRRSAASVERQLSHGRTGATRGAAGSRRTGNVARGSARSRDRDVAAGGSRRTGNAARSAGAHRGGGFARSSSMPRGGGFGGGGHFGGGHAGGGHAGGGGGGRR